MIEGWIVRRSQHYVCVTGVHGVMESQQDESLRQIHNAAGLVTPDGMPLVWISRLKGCRDVGRVYGPDLMLAVCGRSAEKGYRHFLYGGMPGVHFNAGGWMLMAHGYAWASYTDQGGPRGDDMAFVQSMAMLMGEREVGDGVRLQLRTMMSLVPAMSARGSVFAGSRTSPAA